MTSLQRFWRLLRGYKAEIRQIYFYAILIGFVNLSLPLGIQAIINYIILGEITTSWMILVLVVLFGIALNGSFQVLQLRIVEHIQQDIFARASIDFAFRIPKINFSLFDDIHGPALINRYFDIMTIQKGLPKILIDFSLAVFTVFFGLILLAIYSPYFIILAFALVIMLYFIFFLTAKKGLKTSLSESSYKYEIAHILEEIARVYRSFKLHASARLHIKKTDEAVVGYLKARTAHFAVLLNQFKYIIAFKVVLAAGLLILGGLLVINEQMNIGQFVAAEIIIILIIGSVEKILRVIETIYDVLTGLEKIGLIGDMPLEGKTGILELNTDVPLDLKAEQIDFAFKDSTSNILSNLNFEVSANDKVVIKGQSGSGKTTLLKLFSGIHRPTDGSLIINGKSLDQYILSSYFQHVGAVFPTNELFDATLLENVTMGRKVSEKELNEVAAILSLQDFIHDRPLGWQTSLDSAGRRIPRSVIQRILIARALVGKPKLLILEDPLQFVESKIRRSIIDHIMNPDFSCTVLVVADNEYWLTKATKEIQLIKN